MSFQGLEHNTPIRERDYLVSLVKTARLRQVVEVGCYVGMTTLSLARGTEAVIHCIDSLEGNQGDHQGDIARRYGREVIHRTFCENLREYLFRRVFLHVGTSAQYALIWPFKVDAVFVDAEHTYGAVREDIRLWRPHVKRGGFLCGHDYGAFDGVTRAVDEIGPDDVCHTTWIKRI